MEKLTLGNSTLITSRIGLGCMGMSEFYGPSEEDQCLKVLHAALDEGIIHLDTADMYGRGENEKLLSKILKDRRNEVLLATKFGIVRGQDPRERAVNGRPEYVFQACDASLRRLGVNELDLYYLHRVDPKVPIDETVDAMGHLVKAGKVKALGLSECSARTLEKAHRIFPLTALQMEYSLWTRDIEEELLPLCRQLGITLVAYSPLGRGFLAGSISSKNELSLGDYRTELPRFQEENLQHNNALLSALRKIAQEKSCTVAQLALGWVLSQGKDIIPIPGTTKIAHLHDNKGAVFLQLTEEEKRELDTLFPLHAAKGSRYPESAMAMIGR